MRQNGRVDISNKYLLQLIHVNAIDVSHPCCTVPV